MMTDNLNARIAALLNSEADRMKGLEAALGQILSDFQSETGTLHWLDA